jgi:uncharacterized delta-60 repeat protein
VAAAESKSEALEDATQQEAQSLEAKLALALASGDAVEEVVTEVLGEGAAGSNAEANVANALSSGESVQDVVAEAEEAATAEQEANAQAEAVTDPVAALASGEAPATDPEQPTEQANTAEAPAPASEGPGSAPEEAPQDAAEEATTEEPEAAATSESTEVPAEASEPASQDAPQDSEADVSSETVDQTEDTASEETDPLEEATEEDAEAEEAEPESSDVDPKTSEEPSEEVEDTASTEEDSATEADEVTSDEEAVEEGTSDEPAEDTAETEPSDPAEQDDAASNSDESPDPDTEADVPNSDDAPLQSDDPVDEAPQEQVTEEEPLIAEAQTEPDVPQAESAETPASEAASAPEETPSVAAVAASEQNGPFGGGNPFATPALGTTPPAFGANPFGPSSSGASTSTPPQSEAPPTRPVFTPTTPSDGDDQDSAAVEDTAPPANVLPEITVAHILRYTENEAATATAPAISIVDNDTANLEAARVWISDGFEAAEDVLAFTSQAGISGSYDPSTGVLTFSGQAEVSAYQALLQSISYQNTSDHPATLSKTISYQVDDAIGGETLSNVGQTSIEITRTNDAPVLVDFQKTGAEDTDVIFASTDFTNVFSDADGDALAQIEVSTLPQNATLFLNSTVVVSGQVITQADLSSLLLRPDTNFTGTITFDFKASDGTVDSASDATVTVVISAQNDAPTISVSAAAALTEDADASSQNFNTHGTIQFGDVDAGDSISISSSSNGDITWSGGTLASGLSAALVAGFSASVSGASAPGSINWTYAATGLDLDFLGSNETITFSYTITATDTSGANASEQLTLTITGQNDVPVVAALTGSVDENGSAITVTASFTDADSSDSHSFTIDTTSTTGSVVNNGDGTFSYDPNGQFEHLAAGETATDSFTYTVNDANGGVVTETVTLTITASGSTSINVNAVNDVAQISGDNTGSVTENTGTAATGTLTVVDVDAGESSFLAETVTGTYGSLTMVSNGGWSYALDDTNATVQALDDGQSLQDIVTVKSADGTQQNITITISGQNDAPKITLKSSSAFSASLATSANEQARHMLIDSDGKILVGATIDGDAGVLRINSDGTIDTSFGTAGVATFDIGQYDIVHGILQQTNGKYIAQTATVNGHWGAGLVRFNTDGSVDTTFGGTGTGSIFVNTLSKDAPGSGMTILPDGRLIAVGYSNEADGNQIFVLRLSADGVLDTSFGTNGTKAFNPATGSEAPTSVTTLADGNILITGIASENFFLAKLDADGNPVNAFGTNGYVSTDIQGYDEANSIAETSDGKILVSGYTNGGTDIALARYNADGSLDSSFGTNGVVVTDIGGTSDLARSLAVQPDGKILVIGNTGAATQDIFTARYNSDGTLDTSFGTNGILIRDVSSSEIGFDIAVDDNGKFLSLLNTNFGANTDLLIERRNPNGSLDDGSTTYVKGQNPVVIDALIDVSDPELSGVGDFGGARFTLSRNGGANTDDVFGASGNLGSLSQGGLLVLSNSNIGTVTTNSAGSLDITFASGATEAQVEEVMRSVTYQNDAGSPPSSVSLDWTFYDGTSGTPLNATATSTLAIDANADVPSLAYGPQTLDLTGGAYMRVDDTSNLQVTAASGGDPQTYSIEMWVKPDAIGSFQVFFSGDQLGGDTNGTANFGIKADGKFEYEINNVGTIETSNSVFSAGQWTHVAVTHNGDTTTKVYIDGTEASTNTSTIADMTTFSDILIGRRGIGSSFSGEVDEVRIWDTERGTTDIRSNKDQQLSGNETGIIGLWSLNGNSSDSAGSADGTISGSATYSSQTNLQVPSGQELKALLLGEDTEGSSLTLSVDSAAANGTVLVDGAVLTYTNSGGVNDDSFALSVSDQTNSSIQSITVDVI